MSDHDDRDVSGRRWKLSGIRKLPGNPSLDITSLAQWTSSDPSVATIGGDSLDGILITPTGPGTTSIQGSYGGKSASVSITIEQPPTITTTSLPDAQVGVPYDFTLAADNGTPPYVWQIESSFFTETGLTLNTSTESSWNADGGGHVPARLFGPGRSRQPRGFQFNADLTVDP